MFHIQVCKIFNTQFAMPNNEKKVLRDAGPRDAVSTV